MLLISFLAAGILGAIFGIRQAACTTEVFHFTGICLLLKQAHNTLTIKE